MFKLQHLMGLHHTRPTFLIPFPALSPLLSPVPLHWPRELQLTFALIPSSIWNIFSPDITSELHEVAITLSERSQPHLATITLHSLFFIFLQNTYTTWITTHLFLLLLIFSQVNGNTARSRLTDSTQFIIFQFKIFFWWFDGTKVIDIKRKSLTRL